MLEELLEHSSERNVQAVDRIRGDVAELRRVMDRDREAQAARQERLERQVDRYGKKLNTLDERTAALVDERDGPPDEDGHPTRVLAPRRVRPDWKFIATSIVTLLGSGTGAAVLLELVKK